MQVFAGGQRVADFERSAGVGQAHDVAREGIVHHLFLLGHKRCGGREPHLLVETHVFVIDVAFEFARAHFHEGDTRTVVGVHVGMNLENKARESLFAGIHLTFESLCRARTGGYLAETVQQFLHAEIVQSRPEEHRCQLSGQIGLHVEIGIDALQQIHVLAQFGGIAFAHAVVQLGVVEVDGHALRDGLLGGIVEVQTVLVEIIDTLELGSDIDGPGEGTARDFEFLLHLIHQIEGVFALAVHLVDEHDDRRVPHAAHLHQFAGLGLDALGAVYHDDNAVNGREGAVGVFRKILVAGRVEDIDFIVFVLELVVESHHGGGHRDTALFFYLHPVGGRRLADFVRLDGSGHMDGAAEEQQLLGQRRLAGIGVTDDGKSPAFGYFFVQCH